MSETPSPTLTHIRRSTEGRDKTNISLCGIPTPQSSFSYRHARLMYLGRFTKANVPMCPVCELTLKERVRPDEDADV